MHVTVEESCQRRRPRHQAGRTSAPAGSDLATYRSSPALASHRRSRCRGDVRAADQEPLAAVPCGSREALRWVQPAQGARTSSTARASGSRSHSLARRLLDTRGAGACCVPAAVSVACPRDTGGRRGADDGQARRRGAASPAARLALVRRHLRQGPDPSGPRSPGNRAAGRPIGRANRRHGHARQRPPPHRTTRTRRRRCVDQSLRGRGFARQLLETMTAMAGAQGLRTLDLTSRPSRESAVRLYESVGFERRETNVLRYTPAVML